MKTDYIQVIKLWEEYFLWIFVHLCLFDSVCCTSLSKKFNGNFFLIITLLWNDCKEGIALLKAETPSGWKFDMHTKCVIAEVLQLAIYA
jgi:hypothetical protein